MTEAAPTDSLRVRIDHGLMNGFQVAAVTICLVINMIDGFDVLAISFTVKYLPKFLIFSMPGAMVSFATLLVGGGLFIYDAADKLSK